MEIQPTVAPGVSEVKNQVTIIKKFEECFAVQSGNLKKFHDIWDVWPEFPVIYVDCTCTTVSLLNCNSLCITVLYFQYLISLYALTIPIPVHNLFLFLICNMTPCIFSKPIKIIYEEHTLSKISSPNIAQAYLQL